MENLFDSSDYVKLLYHHGTIKQRTKFKLIIDTCQRTLPICYSRPILLYLYEDMS